MSFDEAFPPRAIPIGYTIRWRDVDPAEPRATIVKHLSRQALLGWLDDHEEHRDRAKTIIVDEADGIEACALDTGEAVRSDTCDCFRCDLRSEKALARMK